MKSIYPKLYGSEYVKRETDERFKSLLRKHEALFGVKASALFSSSGRTEIAGNHTDHNNGKVIGASISLDNVAAVSERSDRRVIIASEGFPIVDIDITDRNPHKKEKNTTDAIVRGIAAGFSGMGYEIGGFQANTETKVPAGSGLSSSASVEVLIAEIFNSLYNSDVLSPPEIAKIGQFAENEYFEKPSGLLDQLCSAHGGIIAVDFKDSDNPLIKRLDASFESHGYRMMITSTGGSHADLTGEYSSIPKDMASVASFFGKKKLRDVNFDEFLGSIEKIRKEVKNDRAVLRAYHYFTENNRVDEMVTALEKKDYKSFLSLVNESGSSSFKYLQNVYPSSMPERQAVSIALAASERFLRGEGACRVHGGGFAGTIQAYAPIDRVSDYVKHMEGIFGEGCTIPIAIRTLPVSRIM